MIAGGMSAIITGEFSNQNDHEVAQNIWSGQRIGKNAAENNYLSPKEKGDLVKEFKACNGDQNCQAKVQAKYEAVSKPRDDEFKIAYKACDKNDNCNDLKALHYNLRQQWSEEGNLHYQQHPDEFEKLSPILSIFHTYKKADDGSVLLFGQNNNIKYIHPTLGYEVVLDQNKNIVTDPLNAGTYNFYNPSDEYGRLIGGSDLHDKFDIEPYQLLGNSPKDPTKEYQRGMISRGVGAIKFW